jgi:segregation and condensation protein A
MNSERYQISLEDIFEGPMDLLIHLIRKNEVDIHDIPIALITDQYLAYLEWIKSLNIDVAGNFLLMAATLTQIKSRMLLPVHGNEEEEEDPRSSIARPLMEYLQMKEAAVQLEARDRIGREIFIRSPKTMENSATEETTLVKIGLFELIDAFKRILDNVSPDHQVDLNADRVSVQERISEIAELLDQKGTLTFDELFTMPFDKGFIVVTFLAILEMGKLNLLRITQHQPSGIIRLFYQ